MNFLTILEEIRILSTTKSGLREKECNSPVHSSRFEFLEKSLTKHFTLSIAGDKTSGLLNRHCTKAEISIKDFFSKWNP